MKSVLIFGGTGFLGRALVAALDAAPDFSPVLPTRAQWDITDKASLARVVSQTAPDIVLNMAAISSTGASSDKVYAVNAQGALNLLEVLAQTQFAGRHIFFSSSNVLGAAQADKLGEEARPLPLNHYSCAKLLGEHYCALHHPEVDSTIVRPFSVIGRGQKPYFLLPKLGRHFAERAPEIELGNVQVAKDFVDVRDLVAMLLCLLRSETPPRLVNLCNGEAVAIQTLLQIFKDLSGHDPKITVNPAFIRAKDIHHQCGDPGRIQALGHSRQHSIQDTLRWIYDGALSEGQTS